MEYKKLRTRSMKSFNSKILSKTQLAIQIIDRYQAKKPLHPIFPKINTFQQKHSQLQGQYAQSKYHKKIELDKQILTQMFSYSVQYYYLDITQNMLPLRFIFRNVQNDFYLFLGYNKQFPVSFQSQHYIFNNLVQNKSSSQKKLIKQISVQQQQIKLYKKFDERYYINQDKIIFIKGLKNQKCQKLYFSCVTQKKLVIFYLKIDSISFKPNQSQPKYGRMLTEGNNQLEKHIKEFNVTSSQKDNKNLTFHSQSKLNLFKKLRRIDDEIIKIQSIEKQKKQVQRSTPLIKNFLKQNTKEIKQYCRGTIYSKFEKRKQQQSLKNKSIKVNKQSVQKAKLLEISLKSHAFKCKQLISQFQKTYKVEKYNKGQINRHAISIIYASIFLKQLFNANQIHDRAMKIWYKVHFLDKKFIKKLRKKYIENVLLIPKKNSRTLMSVSHGCQIISKVQRNTSLSTSSKILFNVVTQLKPALLINMILNQTNKYRRAVRLVQRAWLSKNRCRMVMLEYFVRNHVSSMIKLYPHFKMFQKEFIQNNIAKNICVEYCEDQSTKFRHIYQAYRQRILQIKQYIKQNERVTQYNQKHKNNPKIKEKEYLNIPNSPIPPQYRFFRNLDILKSMTRAWFQLKYKVWKKKNLFN